VPHRALLDVHVPLAVAEALRRRGIDVITAQEEGLSLSDDESLLEQSSAQERVLVTQDADFLEIVPRWRREGRASRGVIFARQGMPIGIWSAWLTMSCSIRSSSYRSADDVPGGNDRVWRSVIVDCD
jgi:Domain of unknown function (DUF5615)